VRADVAASLPLAWLIAVTASVSLQASWRLDDFWSANRELLLAEIDEDLLVLTK
jgi:hypothetical protein